MGTKLFVGNLSWNTQEQDLRTHFGAVGKVVAASIVNDRDTGQSRGFGFVEMDSQEGVQNALKFDGKELQGRVIKVCEARPKEDRQNRPERQEQRYDRSDRPTQQERPERQPERTVRPERQEYRPPVREYHGAPEPVSREDRSGERGRDHRGGRDFRQANRKDVSEKDFKRSRRHSWDEDDRNEDRW